MRTKVGAHEGLGSHEDLGAQEVLDTKQALQVYSAQFQLTYLSIYLSVDSDSSSVCL